MLTHSPACAAWTALRPTRVSDHLLRPHASQKPQAEPSVDLFGNLERTSSPPPSVCVTCEEVTSRFCHPNGRSRDSAVHALPSLLIFTITIAKQSIVASQGRWTCVHYGLHRI